MQVQIHFPNGAMNLKHDEVLEIGRGKFGISDMQVSRVHLQIIFSETAETVVVKSLSQSNPSFVWRKGSKQPITLRTNDKEQLYDGDRVSLLHNAFFLGISIQKLLSPGKKRKIPLPERSDTVKQVISQTPSFEEPAPPKRQRVSRQISRSQSSFISPKNFIPESELKLLKVVGSGTCGEVWKANWNGNTVAVKKIFRALLSDTALAEFKSEAKILSSLRHPNVVQFWGFSNIGGDNCIVTEFMERGALDDVVHNKSLDYKTIVKFALGAAEGIRYLHTQEPPIIHRDLKTMNFLVGSDNCVKVSDFGLARHLEPDTTTKTFCGTVPWTAPELLGAKAYTTKVDIYSFGIVLWELCAQKIPYEGMTPSQIIVGVVTRGMRPEIPAGCPSKLARLMERCWDADPEKRPTMEQVIGFLRSLTNDHGEVSTLSVDASLELEQMELTMAGPSIPVVSPDQLKFETLLGAFTTHKAYSGTYNSQRVFIEVFDSSVQASLDAFTTERDIFEKIRTPELPTVLGYMLNPSLCIVTEHLVPDLRSYLQSKKGEMKISESIAIMLACAKSMTVLHTWNPPLLHRNVNSSNFILCNTKDGGMVKMRDLSHATTVNTNAANVIKPEELEYCAPECLDGNSYSCYSDVYSFAIVMWEIINRQIGNQYQRPYNDMPNTFANEVRRQARPKIPVNCPKQLEELICLCWHPIPEERPQFAEIYNCLDQIPR